MSDNEKVVQRAILKHMPTPELHALCKKVRDEQKAFFLNKQVEEDVFCTITSDREWLSKFKQDNPDFDFINFDTTGSFKALNCIDMELGVRRGWWEDWDDSGPIDFPEVFTMTQFGEKPTMAHLVHALGVFPSVTQARKNGFDTPLVEGVHTFTKRKIRAKVIP